MKKITLLISLGCLLTTFVACGQSKSKSTDTNRGQSNAQTDKAMNQNSNHGRTLVAYFSATGVTRSAAEQLAKELNADLFEIAPEQPYTQADLDWTNKQSRSTVEMNDKSSRPAIKGVPSDMSLYDTVYIGFPIWWYTAPTIVNTFVEACDLEGKVVHLFATSGGSSIDKACRDLKEAYPQYQWAGGRLMN